MDKKEARETLIRLWQEKAKESLASAELELAEDHINFAVNRLYYSCFYSVTALLLQDDKQFKRHSAIKAEFNRLYIKSGKINVKWGKFYQKLFDSRQEGDYLPTATFDISEVSEYLAQAKEFLQVICEMISKKETQ